MLNIVNDTSVTFDGCRLLAKCVSRLSPDERAVFKTIEQRFSLLWIRIALR